MVTQRQVRLVLTDPPRVARSVLTRVRLRRTKGRLDPNSTSFALDSRPGPTALAFEQLRQVPGWFTYDDAAHFSLVLGMQSAAGLRGDLLEIGTFHGRSTMLLARHLGPGERLTVCDPFQTGDVYVGNPPTPEVLRRNVQTANPDLDDDALEVHATYSTDLVLDPDRRFRFAHVDGSHERADVAHDLELVDRHLVEGGVVVCDDHDHPDWPGVTQAVVDFRAAHPEYVEVADLNRHAESGRKLYLVRTGGR